MTEAKTPKWDENTVLAGFVVGAIAGALITLLRLPRTGKENRQHLFKQSAELRQQFKASDTVEQSLREGKEAAHRHQLMQ